MTSTRAVRGQSSVVGVALLLGVTVVALGVLTASAGSLVDDQTARADADRVATDLTEALRPVETRGHHAGEVRFADGRLVTVERDLRVLRNGSVVEHWHVGGLVFERGDRRVRSVAGAVVRGRGDSAWVVDPPSVVGSRATDTLVVGAPVLGAGDVSVGGERTTARLSTNVSHDRVDLGHGRFAVAVETDTPAAVETALDDRGAGSITRSDLDGDGTGSVVASFPGRRRGYLVVHRMRLEVAHG